MNMHFFFKNNQHLLLTSLSLSKCFANTFKLAVAFVFLLLSIKAYAFETPVQKHGDLAVYKGQIVNKHQQAVSLAGPSLFWSNNGYEGEAFYNAQSVKAFATDWKAGIIRAAMAAQGKGSYLTNPSDNQKKVERVVDAAIENGIYVIIDWHSHHAEDNTEQAITFFENMAKKYHHFPNVIYEIYNEPLKDTDWKTTIKPYSEQVIAAIRKIDQDNLIIVGTQTWSQDVDKAAIDPIIGYKNIAYALHFYAGTHKEKLRARAQKAIDAGLAIFVSEWGSVNANGDGDIDRESTELWLEFIKKNKLSHCSWSVTNKDEASAFLKPSTTNLGPWPDEALSENGLYLKSIIKNWGY